MSKSKSITRVIFDNRVERHPGDPHIYGYRLTERDSAYTLERLTYDAMGDHCWHRISAAGNTVQQAAWDYMLRLIDHLNRTPK